MKSRAQEMEDEQDEAERKRKREARLLAEKEEAFEGNITLDQYFASPKLKQ